MLRAARAAWAVAMVGIAAGCDSSPPAEVIVDVRTDLVPGREFVAVLAELEGAREDRVVSAGDDFIRGTRIAELRASRGAARLRVSLLAAGAVPILSRDVVVQVRGRVVVTVVLTRRCQGIDCPGAGDSPELTECFGGRCVDPRCSVETPERCGPGECTADTDCASSSPCAPASCRDLACFAIADDALCGPGMSCDPTSGCTGAIPDAGPPALDATGCDDLHAGALFCDGFESDDIGAWGRDNESGGDIAVTGPGYRGGSMMVARWTGPSPDTFVERHLRTPITTGPIHLRGYVLLPSGPMYSGLRLMEVTESTGGRPVQVIVENGRPGIDAPWAGAPYLGSTALPLDRWICLELHLELGASGSGELLVDGVSVAREATDTRPASGYERIAVGVMGRPPSVPGEVHFDEFVVDDAPIGCDP